MGRQDQAEISLIASEIKSGKILQSSYFPFLSLFFVEDCRRKSITLEILKLACITWFFGFIFFNLTNNVFI